MDAPSEPSLPLGDPPRNTPFHNVGLSKDEAALLAALAARLGVRPDYRGEHHVQCPQCGHRVVSGVPHFSFSARGAHCFACGYSAGLLGLARRLDVSDLPPSVTPFERPRAKGPPAWADRAEAYLDRAGARADRVERVRAYKPLGLATMAKHRVGVAPVLDSRLCAHDRIVYPVYEAGAVAAIRGRRLDCSCPQKLLTAPGSRKALWGRDGLGAAAGRPLIICENPLDAAWAMERDPQLIAVALGGVGWDADWTAAIAEARPALALVWLDNDLAGFPHPAIRRQLLEERAAKFRARGVPVPALPPPSGPTIAGQLAKAGLRVKLHAWGDRWPAHADLGDYLATITNKGVQDG